MSAAAEQGNYLPYCADRMIAGACEPEVQCGFQLPGMIGNSIAFNLLMGQIARIAPTSASVLLEGETGVGKELAARAIHYSSTRKSKPFIALNCGALPESLIESELFGHARGAFTDAKTAHEGVVAQAHGGTLFLDEIDTLPVKGQVAMLRFLQDHRYRPLGQNLEQVSDGRVIAASNQPLSELVERGAFRSDLMYRLSIIRLRVPPLRERRSDILLLAARFLKMFAERYGLPQRPLREDCWEWMMRYGWPGNVRELESMIHRSVLLCEGPEIFFEETLPRPVQSAVAQHTAAPPHAEVTAQWLPLFSTTQPLYCEPQVYPDFRSAKAQAIADFERDYLCRVLNETRGNVSAAARLACKERRSFGKLIKKLGILKTEA